MPIKIRFANPRFIACFQQRAKVAIFLPRLSKDRQTINDRFRSNLGYGYRTNPLNLKYYIAQSLTNSARMLVIHIRSPIIIILSVHFATFAAANKPYITDCLYFHAVSRQFTRSEGDNWSKATP
ncbi:hypothetical protein AZF00_05050 [Zhongshania aliphaticivorans]|uniref:Uncharacterized protein n=1 Tax=Zhongshania aliphaticivorans TaxID=1470434 RepID=A0A127M3C1_9GAMM|nr:hypothetical protein AZF00_05050 [Zhongshania aliphaticivorans]